METVLPNISNIELLERCSQGDRNAQCDVYRSYYKMVYQSSYRILNNKVEAEDVMQEAFIEAFQKMDQLKEMEKFGGWLKKIAINKSINEVKKKSRNSIEVEDKHIEVNEEQLDHELQKVKCDRLMKCIEQLPHGFKVITQLFLFEGYDHSEIGEVLGISDSTSRSQFTRAKVRIKEIYQNEYGK